MLKIGFLVLALCYCQVASFAIKSHSESKTATENLDKDTLVFAHVVSETANCLMWNVFVIIKSFKFQSALKVVKNLFRFTDMEIVPCEMECN